jgi:hypothetical protein
MRYWDQFASKYGFFDGELVPADAAQAWRIYVRAVNTKAAKLGSKCRLIPYDRPGTHNPLIIVSTTKEFYDSLDAKERRSGTARCPEGELERGEDKELREAIDWAMERDLDRFITTKVTVDARGLGALLKSL